VHFWRIVGKTYPLPGTESSSAGEFCVHFTVTFQLAKQVLQVLKLVSSAYEFWNALVRQVASAGN
jgi:hypothetical protein